MYRLARFLLFYYYFIDFLHLSLTCGRVRVELNAVSIGRFDLLHNRKTLR